MESLSASTEKPKSPVTATDRKSFAFAAKAPPTAEIEEFFAEAEDYIRKRFAEKYNYDIVKDAPILGGRYRWQWVPADNFM